MSEALDVPIPGGGHLHAVRSGAGPAVVLLHAGGLDHTMWDELAELLADRHEVVRYDARSHGRSSTATGDHRPDDDLEALLDALELDRVALVGCSMGAVAAADFALTRPERVEALVLLGGAVSPPRHVGAFLHELQREQAAAIEARDVGRWVEALVRMSVDGPRRAPADVDPVLRERCRALAAANVAAHHAAAGELLWRGARDRLGELATPTLVVVGEHDLEHIHLDAELLARELPDVRVVDLPEVGHMVSWEAPHAAAGLVADFLARTAAVA